MSELSGLCLDWKNCIVVFFAMSLSKLLCRFCQSNDEDESWYRGHVNRSRGELDVNKRRNDDVQKVRFVLLVEL